VTGHDEKAMVAAVMRLTELAAQVERVENAATRRIDELERRLADIGALLDRMSGQITALTALPAGPRDGDGPDYRVSPSPPWWRPSDERCKETAVRLADCVKEVYRPVYGYLADMLAPCWARHPLCLAYLDALHEAWCLLYIPPRDPRTVFAQLDWLNRYLLQAAEVMANETRSCRGGRHREPGDETGPYRAASWDNSRR